MAAKSLRPGFPGRGERYLSRQKKRCNPKLCQKLDQLDQDLRNTRAQFQNKSPLLLPRGARTPPSSVPSGPTLYNSQLVVCGR